MPINRRRFLSLIGVSAGAAILPISVLAAKSDKLYRWKGILLGSEVSFQLYHSEPNQAKQIAHKAVSEIKRLESIFSLYESKSAISELNNSGYINNAPTELTKLLNKSMHYSKLTNGSFDITVQPLWELYLKNPHPTPKQLKDTLKKVGTNNIEINGDDITLHNNAKITLNGIAQGFITDEITKLLKFSGITNTLVELGEKNALGNHPNGNKWQIGLRNAEGKINDIIPLYNRAIATSGAYGTTITDNKNHLLNPQTGQSAKHHKSISIIANNATEADAISTGLSIMPYKKAKEVLNKLSNIEARFS